MATSINIKAENIRADGSFEIKLPIQVIIEENSSIALQNLLVSGLGTTTSIAVDAFAIEVVGDVSRTNRSTKHVVQIPAGKFADVYGLMNAIVAGINYSLQSGGSISTWRNDAIAPVGPANDLGLGFTYIFNAEGELVVQFHCVERTACSNPVASVGVDTVNAVSNDFLPGGSTGFKFNIEPNVIIDPDEFNGHGNHPILQGGAQMEFRISEIVDNVDVTFGIVPLQSVQPNPPESATVAAGFRRKGNNGDWVLIVDGEEVDIGQVDPDDPDNDRFFIYVRDGGLHVAILNNDYEVLYDSYVTSPNLFSFFNLVELSKFEVYVDCSRETATADDGIVFVSVSYTQQKSVQLEPTGWVLNPVVSRKRITAPIGAVVRTPFITFIGNAGKEVARGLGFLSETIKFDTPDIEGSDSAQQIPFFSFTPNLALEIMNVPVKNYQADDSGRQGTARNVVQYLSLNTGVINRPDLLSWNNYSVQYLDIGNKSPLNISTLFLRLFDVQNGDAVSPSYLNCTLLFRKQGVIV